MENFKFKKDKYVFDSRPSMLVIGELAEDNRNKEIALFLKELILYNVLLKDLVNFSLNEKDRCIALNIAYYITENEELLKIIIRKKDLPISKLSKLIKIKPEYIEKCRDYIIAYYIILINPDYRHIQEYFRINLREDNNLIRISSKKQNLYKGLVIRSLKKFAYIVTSKGEFIKIKTNSKASIGELCEGKKKKTLRNFRIHISILLVVLILIGSGIIIEYRRTESIIVIQTTSDIKISINKFNKVIYAYSSTDKGKELVKNVNMLNVDIDEAMAETFEYALNNEMIELNKEVPTLSKKTLITINGQALEYGALTKTNKVISENNIPIVINNAGSQQKLPKYLSEDGENKTEK